MNFMLCVICISLLFVGTWQHALLNHVNLGRTFSLLVAILSNFNNFNEIITPFKVRLALKKVALILAVVHC